MPATRPIPEIDANQRELCRRRPIANPLSRACWLAEPALWTREIALFRERGVAQLARRAAA